MLQFTIVYLNDIIIFSPNADKHMSCVSTVLPIFHNAGVILSHKKCKLFTDRIKYFGLILRTAKLKWPYHITNATSDLKPPCNQTELESFLSLCITFSWFVPNFVRTAAFCIWKWRNEAHVTRMDFKWIWNLNFTFSQLRDHQGLRPSTSWYCYQYRARRFNTWLFWLAVFRYSSVPLSLQRSHLSISGQYSSTIGCSVWHPILRNEW